MVRTLGLIKKGSQINKIPGVRSVQEMKKCNSNSDKQYPAMSFVHLSFLLNISLLFQWKQKISHPSVVLDACQNDISLCL